MLLVTNMMRDDCRVFRLASFVTAKLRDKLQSVTEPLLDYYLGAKRDSLSVSKCS